MKIFHNTHQYWNQYSVSVSKSILESESESKYQNQNQNQNQNHNQNHNQYQNQNQCAHKIMMIFDWCLLKVFFELNTYLYYIHQIIVIKL